MVDAFQHDDSFLFATARWTEASDNKAARDGQPGRGALIDGLESDRKSDLDSGQEYAGGLDYFSSARFDDCGFRLRIFVG
jgi:hypothetical protein